MNFLMLRGQVPTGTRTKEIVFNKLEDVDDMWTQLFYALLEDNYGELWYWGGDRKKKFADNFIERWVPNFKTHKADFVPDLIFCRGGFKEYHTVLKKFPKALKIYYGAGRRFLPQPGFDDYDIVLQDSIEQVAVCKKRFPKPLITLFIKPAADNIFYPMPKVEKMYDICFPANAEQSFKGHAFVYKTVPKDLKVLNLGNKGDRFKRPKNVESKRVIRSDMAKNIAKCKMGIVAVRQKIDSCPRVIPELISCGVPIVVRDKVRFWQSKYIVSGVTGELASDENFWDVVKYVLENLDKYNPRQYYEENLSLKHAAKFLRSQIYEVSFQRNK